jgi:hypothetical protein
VVGCHPAATSSSRSGRCSGDPENQRAIAYHMTHATVADLYTEIARSAECTSKAKSSPHFHLNASIDAARVIAAHDYPARVAMEGHVVNFLSVAMNVDFISTATTSRAWSRRYRSPRTGMPTWPNGPRRCAPWTSPR